MKAKSDMFYTPYNNTSVMVEPYLEGFPVAFWCFMRLVMGSMHAEIQLHIDF